MNAKTQVIPMSPGRAAADRCRPYIDKARTSFLDVCKKIGNEYSALANDQKQVFRHELCISDSTAKAYARVGLKADEKLRLIEGAAGGPLTIPPSIEVWKEIVSADDSALKTAAKSGLFTEYEITKRTIAGFKRTGQLPAIKKSEKKSSTALSKVRSELQKAEKAINTAVGHVSKARKLIEDNAITDVRGPEVRAFKKQFELLCAEIAAANPDLLDNALKVLRGEK